MYNTLAIVDTGAANSHISRNFIDKLKLLSNGVQAVNTMTEKAILKQYSLGIIIGNSIKLEAVNLLEFETISPFIDVIIGKDILNLGDFAFSQKKDKLCFSLIIPSKEDFVILDENIIDYSDLKI